ncbi:hypothetical protein SAMN05216241_102228 [Limimonas halophila]|uniref:Uncharacterized protein n=1 Tax=Limimonas halophila TaxID=1082479 RepID=A0A1G7NMI3_9PROT|nr:hypothetical protein [Limimonas halophila]SDF75274.1 hypothetical protein SAMN05216241_102228 [Limimonas halophila]
MARLRTGAILAAAALAAVPATAAAQDRDALNQRFGTPRVLLTAAEAERLRAILVEQTAETEGGDAADQAPQKPALALENTTPTSNGASEPADPAPPPGPVQLDALVYLGPGTWTFWLDGKRFTPGRAPRGFTVERVTNRSVTLRWRPGGQRSYRFTLRPRQTFIPARGKVVDGAARTGTSGAADG